MNSFNSKNSEDKVPIASQGREHRPFFQPKLTINQPNDVYEQEADAMADSVMRMADPLGNDASFFKPLATGVQRKCQHCEEEEKLHRKESSSAGVQGGHELDSYVGSLHSSGRLLPDTSRSFFEPRFGQDFSNVRIHTDSVAAKSAQSINALAYTTGNNIVFNSGQFSPESDSGKRLMAHELTHVIQQSVSKIPHKTHQETGISDSSIQRSQQTHSTPRLQSINDKSILQKKDDPIPVDLVPTSPEEEKRLKEMGINLPTVSDSTWRAIGGIADNSGKSLSEPEKNKIQEILKTNGIPAASPLAGVNGPKFLLHDTSASLGAAKLQEEVNKGRGPMGAGVSGWIPRDTPAVVARPNFYESKRPSTTEYEKGIDIIKQADREAALIEVWKFTNETTRDSSLDNALSNQGLKPEEITAIKDGAKVFLNGSTTKVDGARTAGAWAVGDICSKGSAASAVPGKEKDFEAGCAKLKQYFQERPGRSQSFVTVEIVQVGAKSSKGNQNTCDPKNPNITPMPNPPYSDNQYLNIALLYLRAALTAGSFPEITTHFVVDAFEKGHCDPRCFDLDNLYKQIAILLGHGIGSTYGVKPKYGLSWGTNTIWWDNGICGKASP
jgi:hypothetical protein